ncbi:MAG: hemerythrin domain-containing protein [Caulobacteraceae bacterium]|nr:hemerythrin domain-containing protein [Caulobacteraceae bacterium]
MPKSEDEPKNGGQGGRRGAAAGNGGAQGQGSSAEGAAAGKAAGQTDAIAMLKEDHRKVEGLFERAQQAQDDEKDELIQQICQELIIHTELEERIFYPASRQPSTEDQLDEAQVEHDGAKLLVLELMDGDDADEYRDAKLKVLSEQVKMHIREEEAADGVFAKAQKAGANTTELAERLTQMKEGLQRKAKAEDLPEPRPVSFQFLQLAGGRQTGSRGARGRYESGRPADEEGRRQGGRSFQSRGRDDYGRFAERGPRYRDDDDERGYAWRGRERGHGGWFGDPEGHAEASRRGWDEREGRSRSYRGDEDERRYAARGQGGWYGDPEGHSEASRRGWEERERGGRPRYGEEGGYASRGRGYRDDEDDDHRGGGRGGWSGDPEGHAEAARRGWQNRR